MGVPFAYAPKSLPTPGDPTMAASRRVTSMSEGEHAPIRPQTSAQHDVVIFRHRLSTRIWHWTNAVVFRSC